MTPEERALRDAYLAEMWPVCREIPREQREIQREIDRRTQVADTPVDKAS